MPRHSGKASDIALRIAGRPPSEIKRKSGWRIDVQFSKDFSAVTELLEQAGDRGVMASHRVLVFGHAELPVLVRVEPGEDATSRFTAAGGRDKCLREANALPCQPVEVRRLYVFLTVAAEMRPMIF